MWMVALVYLFGMKSIWNHWMWGFLMAAFFMSYMGKWVRRSRRDDRRRVDDHTLRRSAGRPRGPTTHTH